MVDWCSKMKELRKGNERVEKGKGWGKKWEKLREKGCKESSQKLKKDGGSRWLVSSPWRLSWFSNLDGERVIKWQRERERERNVVTPTFSWQAIIRRRDCGFIVTTLKPSVENSFLLKAFSPVRNIDEKEEWKERVVAGQLLETFESTFNPFPSLFLCHQFSFWEFSPSLLGSLRTSIVVPFPPSFLPSFLPS